MNVDLSPIAFNPYLYGIGGAIIVSIALSEKLDKSPLLRWVRAAFTYAARRRVRDDDQAYRELEIKLERILDNLAELRAEVKSKDDELAEQFRYIVWVTAWARDVMIAVAQVVPPLALPRFLSLSEWRTNTAAEAANTSS